MGATYDSQERFPAPRCFPGTRGEILEKIEKWVNAGGEGKRVLWLHGPAGAGKSAIAQTVAETCAGRNQLAATFFFARTVAGRNAIKYLFPTVAVQIALSAREKRERLYTILKNDPWIADRASGSVDLVTLLFKKRSDLVPSLPFLVIVDGLDECQGHGDQCRILTQVSHMVNPHCHLPLRFLIVSRPESHLLEAFKDPAIANIAERLSLYGDFQAHDDVFMYLRSEFSRIHDSQKHRDVMEFVPRPWPSDDAMQQIACKSGGYFIYASTIIKFIDEEDFSPTACLGQVLDTCNPPLNSTLFSELDKLYLQILSLCPTSNLPILKYVLGCIVVPLLGYDRTTPAGILMDMDVIEAFLGLPRGHAKLILRRLRSLVSFGESPEDVELPRLYHASFGDFLLDQERSRDYHVDSEEWMYNAFCDAFSLGCKMLGFKFPTDTNSESISQHPAKGLFVTLTSFFLKFDLSL